MINEEQAGHKEYAKRAVQGIQKGISKEAKKRLNRKIKKELARRSKRKGAKSMVAPSVARLSGEFAVQQAVKRMIAVEERKSSSKVLANEGGYYNKNDKNKRKPTFISGGMLK